MSLGRQRPAAVGVRIPPRHLPAPPCLMHKQVSRDIAVHHINDVVIRGHSAGGRGGVLEFRPEIRRNIQRCEQRPPRERRPKQAQANDHADEEKQGRRPYSCTTDRPRWLSEGGAGSGIGIHASGRAETDHRRRACEGKQSVPAAPPCARAGGTPVCHHSRDGCDPHALRRRNHRRRLPESEPDRRRRRC